MADRTSQFVQAHRSWFVVAAAFGLGYLTGAKGPTPPLSRFATDPQPTGAVVANLPPFMAMPIAPATQPAPATPLVSPTGPTPSDLAALHGTLLRVRTKLQLYAMQHGDRRPTLAQLQRDWSSLTACTDDNGDPTDPGPMASGPYLETKPVNPVTQSAGVTAAGRATADAGWTYDEKTGELRAVLPYGVKWPPLDKAGVERVSAKPITATAGVSHTP